jgi:hypothetical protein
VRQQLLDAIYDGKPFRQVLRNLGLTPNQVWGLTKTDDEWSTALDAALSASQLDWWVKERREWWGRVRGQDGRQRWVRAVDLRRPRGNDS